MESKELNEILNKTRRTPNISLTPKQVEEIINDLEVLEIIKKAGILDLVFSEDPYCNLVITNRDVINVDYDGRSPDIEMTFEDYEKIKRWLDGK